jgi:hypothetical protein
MTSARAEMEAGTGHRWCPCHRALAEEAALERCRTWQWPSRRLGRGEDRRSFRQGRGARAQGPRRSICAAELLAHPFLARRPPKSPDRRDFPALSADRLRLKTATRRFLPWPRKGLRARLPPGAAPRLTAYGRGSAQCDAGGSHRRSADRARVPTHAMDWSADHLET